MFWKIKNSIRLELNRDLLEILILLAIFIGVFEIHYWNRFYPNIFIGDTNVSGKTFEEVLGNLKQAQERISQNGLTLVFFRSGASKEIVVPMVSYGLTSDAVVEYYSLGETEKTIEEAFNFGRRGSIFKRLGEQFILIISKKKISSPYSLQEEAVRSLLGRDLGNFYNKPESASFSFKGQKLEINPEKSGEQVDNYGDKIIRLISQSLANLDSEVLFFSPRPAMSLITKEKLQLFSSLAQEIVKKSRLEFSYDGYRWLVSGDILASWLTLSFDGRSLIIDKDKLEVFLNNKIKPLVYNLPQNSRFEIQNGRLVEIFKGVSGNSIAADKIEETINNQLREYQRNYALAKENQIKFLLADTSVLIPIKIITELPKITSETIGQYGIKELITKVKTSFKGSTEGRKHNIQIGIDRLNGVLIAPEEEFSAVEAIGLTREEDGFVKEFVIKGDRSVKEAGGGLCQIATTLFRLAINSGLPVTARTNHLYVVSYYGPGLDATIYGPKKDLKFVNDTGHYLLLQAKVVGNEVEMEFYGNKDGREITISEPKLSDRIPPPAPKYVLSPDLPRGTEKCTEQARFGVTAEASYLVKYLNGKTNEQIFKSVYRPWQKVCLVGADKKDSNILTNL